MRDAVLALELSTSLGSIAVVGGGEVLFEASFEAKRSHNALLFGPLGEALQVVGNRLRGILVGTGPGSYTGVRIAIAAAHGMALSKQVPVLGVSSFLGCVDDQTFGVVGDARRGRLYLAEIRDGVLKEEIALMAPDEAPQAMSVAGLSKWISCDPGAPLHGVELVVPSASRLALAGQNLRFDDPPDKPLEPIYLEGAFITQPRKR